MILISFLFIYWDLIKSIKILSNLIKYIHYNICYLYEKSFFILSKKNTK